MSGVWLGVNTPRGDCVGLLASLVGLYIIFSVSRGRARTTCTLDHLPMLFRPYGAEKFRMSSVSSPTNGYLPNCSHAY